MDVSTSGYSQLNLFPSGFDVRAWNPSGQVVPAPFIHLLQDGFMEVGGAWLGGPGSDPGSDQVPPERHLERGAGWVCLPPVTVSTVGYMLATSVAPRCRKLADRACTHA